MPTLCLGEALVDLICRQPVESVAEADSFVPHFGGAIANVAVAAARQGADVALAGGAGLDAWGRWLHGRLAAEGVRLDWFRLVPDERTPVAFVTVDADGEPTYEIYGEELGSVAAALGDRVDEAVDASDALFFSTNTLIGEQEREVTLRAREHALEIDRPVVFDPNLRLGRWPTATRAAGAARECVPGAFLVKCNSVEAQLITGERNPDAQAAGLLAAGARNVVITLGAEGAILRGPFKADVHAPPASVVSTVGAGDAVMGVLLARLALTDYYAPVLPVALPEALAEAARATERWGALA